MTRHQATGVLWIIGIILATLVLTGCDRSVSLTQPAPVIQSDTTIVQPVVLVDTVYVATVDTVRIRVPGPVRVDTVRVCDDNSEGREG